MECQYCCCVPVPWTKQRTGLRKKLLEALFCLYPGKGCGQDELCELGQPPHCSLESLKHAGLQLSCYSGHWRCGGSRTLGSVTVVQTGEMQFLPLPGSSDTQPTLSCFLCIFSPLSSLTSELSGPGTTSVVTPDNVPA